MDMLQGEQIAAAKLTDWRKLAQGLHARYLVDDFGTGVEDRARTGVRHDVRRGVPLGDQTAADALVTIDDALAAKAAGLVALAPMAAS